MYSRSRGLGRIEWWAERAIRLIELCDDLSELDMCGAVVGGVEDKIGLALWKYGHVSFGVYSASRYVASVLGVLSAQEGELPCSGGCRLQDQPHRSHAPPQATCQLH